MNVRLTAAITGAIILALGLVGLFKPEAVPGMVGFGMIDASNRALALGEVRAMYGGLFVAMGICTLWVAVDPAAYRDRLLVVGLLWLGLGLGRLFSVSFTGNPGVFGWLFCVFEVGLGSVLTVGWWVATTQSES